MADVNKLSEIAFQIITSAGTAKSLYIEAMQCIKEGKTEECNKKIEEADEYFNKGHEFHIGLIVEESTTLEPQVSLLLVHAEDQLMSVETTKLLVTEIIELYKKRS